MLTVYKYTLLPRDVQTIELPVDARILCIVSQNDVPCIFAEVDPTKPIVQREFLTVKTGRPIPELLGMDRSYVDTAQIDGGRHVFHIYELTKAAPTLELPITT